MYIIIVGAGNVGATAAQRIAEKIKDEEIIFDTNEFTRHGDAA